MGGPGLALVTRHDDPVRFWQRLEPTDAARNAQSPGRLIISYDATLPFGVALTVNVVDWAPRYNLDMLLMMFPEPDGQTGHCGDFNGVKEDDWIPTMRRLGSQTFGAPSSSETAVQENPADESGCTTEAHANATAVCTGMCGDVAGAFLEACVYDVCRAGPDVGISDCLIAWQTKVATNPTISQKTKRVGPGCCRPAKYLQQTVNEDATMMECEAACRASTHCDAFAISGCSSSTDALCGGSCHLYRIGNDRQQISAGSCMDSALDGNTFCYTIDQV